MALTQQEFNTVLAYQAAAQALDGKVNSIRALMDRVVQRSDPSDPLNGTITMASLYASYYQLFNQEISGLASLSALFLNPLPPPA